MIPIDVRISNFLDSVSFLADLERQRIAWSNKTPGATSVVSLGELYAQFFDDNDIDNFVRYELDTSPLNTEQRESVLAIRDALNAFSKAPGKTPQPVNDEELLSDPEWNTVVALAQSVLKVFRGNIV